MNQFPSAREAKEFVIREIAKEAKRQGVPISEIERKMLYFSETDWTLPGMPAVADAFHREYDENDYEQKIQQVIRSARTGATEKNETSWSDAIERLNEGDHYLSVLIGSASKRPRWDRLRLISAALAVVAMFISLEFGLAWYLGHDVSRGERAFYGWIAALSTAGIYLLLRLVFGGRIVHDYLNRTIDWVFGSPDW